MSVPGERMVRVPEGRLLAGVCTGLGAFTGIDPLVYRIGFALMVLAHGQGILLYLAALLLMPAAPGRPAVADGVFRRWFDGQTVLALLGAQLGLALVLNVATVGMRDSAHGGPAGDALTSLTVLGLALLVAQARGADLTALLRSMPERLRGRPLPTAGAGGASSAGSWSPAPGVPASAVRTSADGPPAEGMVDLALYGVVPAGSRTAPADGPVALTKTRSGATDQGPAGTGRSTRSGRRSVSTVVTLLLAVLATAAVIPAATDAPSGLATTQILLATALGVVAVGLITAAVRGHGGGLVAIGVLMTISLTATSIIGEVPVNGRYGSVRWHPVDASTTEQKYRLIVGDGRLNLTGLPLTPGGRTIVNAQFVLGELKVTLPRTARAELHLKVGLGDITVDQRITSGPRARVDTVLQPLTTGTAPAARTPVIELRVQGRVGDLAVSRA